MAGIAWFVGTAILTAGAFAAGWAAAGRSRRWAVGAAAAALAVLVAKAALTHFPVIEARLFPWPWHVYLQGYWLWPVTLLFFGIAARQLPVRWNRAVVGGVAAIMFACSLHSARWMAAPQADSSDQRADASGHCRQTTGYTCVPASCVAVLAWWGINTTEGEMARLCLTSSWGTSTFNAYRGLTLKLREVADADGRGLEARMIGWDPERLRKLAVPAVVSGGPGHAVAVRFEADAFVLHDPLAFQPCTYASPPAEIAGPAVVVVERGREPSAALGRIPMGPGQVARGWPCGATTGGPGREVQGGGP